MKVICTAVQNGPHFCTFGVLTHPVQTEGGKQG